jgi:phage I-like protein
MFKQLLALAPAAADLKALPERLLVLPWGEQATAKGKVICNSVTMQILPEFQRRVKFDRVALDFQHNTVESSSTYKGEPTLVAAYGNLELVPNSGVFLTNISYTDEGKKILPGGHYPDISPAVIRNDDGVVIGLHSIGAVRQGELDGLTLFSAPSFAAAADEIIKSSKETQKIMDHKKILLALLGLADDATDEAIKTAADALGKKLAAKLEDKPKDEPKPAADIAALSAEVKGLQNTLNTIISGGEKDRRDALVAKAAAEGKVIPLSADNIASLPLTALEDLVQQLPVTVPLNQRTPGVVVPFNANLNGGVEDEVRANLGISKEDWDKVNKK